VHVLADDAPAPGFTPVEAGLEDVYFSTLHQHRSASAGVVAGAEA
jgi:hypothetical protein